MKRCIISVFLIFAVCCPAAAAGKDIKIDTSIDFFRNYGETTYTITGQDGLFVGDNFKSELEFPLETWFTRLGIHAQLLERFDISLDYAWSFGGSSGEFIDTDWSDVISAGPVIKSKANADITGTEFNADIKFLVKQFELNNGIFDRIKVLIGGGYKNQNFEYDVHDVSQKSDFFPAFFNVDMTGNVLDYNIEYKIWYLSLYLDILNTFNNMDMLIGMEYGPNIDAEDRDDHVQRFKLSESSGDGTYEKYAIQFNANVWKNFWTSVYYNYIKISVNGYQDQRWYDGSFTGSTITGIDWTSDSRQAILGVKFLWKFN